MVKNIRNGFVILICSVSLSGCAWWQSLSQEEQLVLGLVGGAVVLGALAHHEDSSGGGGGSLTLGVE